MTDDVVTQLRELTWLPPWEPTSADLAAELTREAGPGHILHQRTAIAVARRLDQDDVLFWLPEGPALLAAVHLTYAGRERSPEWPGTQLFHSVDDWVTQMRADHAEHSGTPREGQA